MPHRPKAPFKPQNRWLIVLAGLVLVAALCVRYRSVVRVADWVWIRTGHRATVADQLQKYGEAARGRLRPHFQAAGVAYPPHHIVMLAIKSTKRMEVWAAESGPLRHVTDYPILAASGSIGPKLREGDRQVPEGFYTIDSLNPNSLFHLSIRVAYPNDLDKAQAAKDGRTHLGGDIMIHGEQMSAGCLAMGDQASEDLFVLAADTGIRKIQILISPVDLRVEDAPADPSRPQWIRDLYDRLRRRVCSLGSETYPASPRPGLTPEGWTPSS